MVIPFIFFLHSSLRSVIRSPVNGRDTFGGFTAERFSLWPARVTHSAEAGQRPSLEAVAGADFPEGERESRPILNKPAFEPCSPALAILVTCFRLLDVVRTRDESLRSFSELRVEQNLRLSGGNRDLRSPSDNSVVVSIRVITTVKKYGPLGRTTEYQALSALQFPRYARFFGPGALAMRELQ